MSAGVGTMWQVDSASTEQPSRPGHVIALVGLMAAGGALRLWPIASRHLWHDEVMTWKAAKTGLASILSWQHHYEHPPLSYLLTWLSMQTFSSDAPWVLRLPAAVCGIVCIAAVYGLGVRLAGAWTGLIAAALVAFDFNAIIQSQQARMYTLTVLAVTLTLIAIDAAVRRARWPWWVLVGTGLAAAFSASHMGLMLAAALPLGLMVWLAWRQHHDQPTRRARTLFVGMGIAYATAILWCSVGAVVMLSRLEWFRAKSGSTPWLARLAGLSSDFAHAYASPWLATAVLVAGVIGLVLLLRRRPQHRPTALVLLVLIVVNILFALPVQPHGFEPRPRYVIVMQLPLWIGVAYLVASARRWTLRIPLLLAVAAAMAWLAAQSLHHGELDRYRLGGAIEAVRPRVQPGDNVIYYPAWIDENGVYYGLPPTHTPPTMEWGSQHATLHWNVSPTDRPTWLIIAYHHETGATDAAPDIVASLAQRYGTQINRAAITHAIREQPVVVLRINRAGVVMVRTDQAHEKTPD